MLVPIIQGPLFIIGGGLGRSRGVGWGWGAWLKDRIPVLVLLVCHAPWLRAEARAYQNRITWRPGDVLAAMAVYHALSRKHSGLGAEVETDFYRQWWLLRALFPRMCLSNVWERPIRKAHEDVVVAENDDAIGFISDLDYSPTGRLLAGSCTSNAIYVFDPNRGSLIKTFNKPHNDAVSKVRFVSEYQFVSGSADCSVGYWDMRFPSKALNFLQGHTKPIRSLDYLSNTSTLITSSQDGFIRYWHLPTFALKNPEPSLESSMRSDQKGSLIRGPLLKCPNFNLCQFSESLAVCANTNGTLFYIDNLSVQHIKDDLCNIRFDESTKLQLCWFAPSASSTRRNRVQVIEHDEYSPVAGARVSSVSHLSLHPSLPILLMRNTTTKHTQTSQEVKDWTCVCRLKQQLSLQEYSMLDMNGFGTDVLEDRLLFSIEEMRYAPFREKQPCFSLCGRVIASPEKHGIRLLGFSSNVGTCQSPVTTRRNPCPMDSLFSAGYWPNNSSPLEVLAHLPGPEKSVVCCQFSPVDNTLLAVGDSECHISFYKPKL